MKLMVAGVLSGVRGACLPRRQGGSSEVVACTANRSVIRYDLQKDS